MAQPKHVDFGVNLHKSHNGESYLVLSYKNDKNWHTYWKNPGDSGLSIKNFFRISGEKTSLKASEWPYPLRFKETSDLWTFGYKDSYSLYYPLSSDQLAKLEGEKIAVETKYLVCDNICIPGKNEFHGTFKNGTLVAQNSYLNESASTLNSRLKNLPQKVALPSALKLYLIRSTNKKGFILRYTFANISLSSLHKKKNLLTPFRISPFDFKHELLFFDKKTKTLYGEVEIDWDGEYLEPALDYPTKGTFSQPYLFKFLLANPNTNKIEVIEKSFRTFSLEDPTTVGTFYKTLTPINTDRSLASTANSSTEGSFFLYLLFAFLGGLILNIMPCVLPVIAIKLFGLVQQNQSKKAEILQHNLVYTLGVLATFLVLGIAIILLQRAGEQVGWGFQLQSPYFVGVMTLGIFIFALNLFGLFEFQTPGGKLLGNQKSSKGFAGAFSSGVVTTILATPCSAPFLGTALTFAFLSTPITIILMFLMIGLGLSFPFIVIGFFPKLISFLPRPGNWMNTVKRFLGLALIVTVIWLQDILSALINDSAALFYFNLALAFTFFALYFANHISKKLFSQIIIFLLPLIALVLHWSKIDMNQSLSVSQQGATTLLLEKQKAGLPWEPWSREKLANYKRAKQVVFIDFTAKWCLTCKVNEKLVLETQKFKDFIEANNIKLLLGDWTRRDPVITSWLKSHNIFGVPAYFLLNKNGILIKLGETISIGKIKQNL